jgi:hypothetical protein
VKFFSAKKIFSLVVLFAAPCLYSQAGLRLQGLPPGGEGLSRSAGNESAVVSRNDAFGKLFRIPDFESPRPLRFGLTNLANTTSANTGSGTESQAVSVTPLWLKDLRRAEIVAFGSFPLTIFWTSFFLDLYRTSSHGWDNRYAPWPFKGAGAVSMTNQEIAMMFAIAISSSVIIAVVDHFILRYRRSRAGDSGKPVRLDKMPQEPPASSRPVIIPEG